jgi:hypothetical protein
MDSKHAPRAFASLVATLTVVGGYVHLCLYRHGYRTIPKIGVGFLLQVVGSALVGVALTIGPRRLARLARVSERRAMTFSVAMAGALSAGTLVAFVLTRTNNGLFGFQERGLEPAPQALVALVAEVGVLVAASTWFLAAYARPRRVHPVPHRPV